MIINTFSGKGQKIGFMRILAKTASGCANELCSLFSGRWGGGLGCGSVKRLGVLA